MNRLFLVMVALALPLGSVSAQTSDEKKIIDSFNSYVQHHLDSYKTNRREQVLHYPGGWIHQYYELDASASKIDLQRTNSLLSPYVGTLEFRLIRHATVPSQSREVAAADTNFVDIYEYVHLHKYAYQGEKWVPQTRRFHAPENDRLQIRTFALLGKPVADDYIEWFDCDDRPDQYGQVDIRGCLEEFDDKPYPSEQPHY